jgi:hypothetical protein
MVLIERQHKQLSGGGLEKISQLKLKIIRRLYRIYPPELHQKLMSRELEI